MIYFCREVLCFIKVYGITQEDMFSFEKSKVVNQKVGAVYVDISIVT